MSRFFLGLKSRFDLLRIARALFLGGAFVSLVQTSQAGPSGKALEIYFVDVEGGQATLFVTPEGQSLLVDTGWPGNAGRDADRIVAAAKKSGLSKIDFVLLTHYHQDHVGGVPQLLAAVPVGAFIDHGVNREPGERETEQGWLAYQKLITDQGLKRIIAKSWGHTAYPWISCAGREFRW